MIHDNDHFLAAIPYAARWPLEVHVRAKRHGTGRLGDLTDEAALDLVARADDVVARYDALWGFELPVPDVRAGGTGGRRATGTSTSSSCHRTATRNG